MAGEKTAKTDMPLRRKLIWLIVLKLVILFGVLRLFIFKPAMAGMTDEQKSEQVGAHLTLPQTSDDSTFKLLTDQ